MEDRKLAPTGRTVNVTLVDGKLVRLVFDGEDDNPVTIEASAKLEDYPELKEVKTAKGKTPRDKRLRALLNCDGGTLQYDDDDVTYRINVLEQQEERLPNDCNGLLRLKAEKAKVLEHNESVHSEPDAHSPYVERDKEWKQVEKLLGCLGPSLADLRCMKSEKKRIFTLEYATMSGAGKSRFVMHQFGKEKFMDIPMSLVGLNFNGGTGGGSDTYTVIDTILEEHVDMAMSRLLLSRGLFWVHPDLKIFNGDLPLPNLSLPSVADVIEALFQDKFRESKGQGLLVVHLDELWQLKKQMKIKLRFHDSAPAKRKEILDQVNSLVKRFISILLEYSVKNHTKGRYILPVVSHTCPDNDLLENRAMDQTLYSPKGLHLFPFSVDQSMELLRRKRKQICKSHLDEKNRKRDRDEMEQDMQDIKWENFENIVALAGGHPSLLLDSFPGLLNHRLVAGRTQTSEGAMMYSLMENPRVESFAESIGTLETQEMSEFLTDSLLRVEVPVDKHQAILGVGVGWFQPTGHGKDLRTGLMSSKGLVSAPFPITVTLMNACEDGGGFSEIGAALDPRVRNYAPTKAMEFVSALAVLLRRMESVSLWQTFTSGDAFDVVENHSKSFFSVWPISNQAVVDFGGKLGEWKILGQTKMQESGKEHTTQSLAEVMEMAWRIGRKVRNRQLTGKVHAYWVSSRKAQPQNALQRLVRAFRVAMSGTITKKEVERRLNEEAKELGNVEEMELAEGEAEGKKKKAVDVRLLIGLLNRITMNNIYEFTLDNNYEFTYVGPTCAKQDDDDSVLPLSDLLPKGIFAGWA